MSMDPSEFARHLNAVTRPGGHPADQLARAESARWLVARAGDTYPLLLDALRTRPSGVDAEPIIDLLPDFRREESIPVLREILLSGAESVARAAGTALGRHRQEGAAEVLREALQSAHRECRIGALLGWLQRPAEESCPVLARLAPDEDSLVEQYRLQVLERLGCQAKEWR